MKKLSATICLLSAALTGCAVVGNSSYLSGQKVITAQEIRDLRNDSMKDQYLKKAMSMPKIKIVVLDNTELDAALIEKAYNERMKNNNYVFDDSVETVKIEYVNTNVLAINYRMYSKNGTYPLNIVPTMRLRWTTEVLIGNGIANLIERMKLLDVKREIGAKTFKQ